MMRSRVRIVLTAIVCLNAAGVALIYLTLAFHIGVSHAATISRYRGLVIHGVVTEDPKAMARYPDARLDPGNWLAVPNYLASPGVTPGNVTLIAALMGALNILAFACVLRPSQAKATRQRARLSVHAHPASFHEKFNEGKPMSERSEIYFAKLIPELPTWNEGKTARQQRERESDACVQLHLYCVHRRLPAMEVLFSILRQPGQGAPGGQELLAGFHVLEETDLDGF